MMQPVGGMDQIGIAFEARVSQDILYEAVVNEIRKIANGARIIYQVRSGPSQMLDADLLHLHNARHGAQKHSQ